MQIRVSYQAGVPMRADRSDPADVPYELWWTNGADHKRGRFHERLHLDATPVPASSFSHIVGAAVALDRFARVTPLRKTLKKGF